MRDTILQGDVLAVLKTLPDSLVDCVVTSPPYWGLRDYGSNGQMGLEPTLEEYIAKMTAVFSEVRRVLKDTGTLWLNMGDAYNGSGKASGQGNGTNFGKPLSERPYDVQTATKVIGLKPKDLIGQPWRLAFALQADGWYLRSDIIWVKPNPMPESVTDRPTKSHEYVFLMSKRAKYFYDAEAIKEDCSESTHARISQDLAAQVGSYRAGGGNKTNGPMKAVIAGSTRKLAEEGSGIKANKSFEAAMVLKVSNRNKRTVWTIATQPYPEAHFATFPEKLVEPCIRAGTSERGYCVECGLPWVRVVERGEPEPSQEWNVKHGDDPKMATRPKGKSGKTHAEWKANNSDKFIGWQPTCACSADTVPGLVLDPFMGSGTVALVAKKLDRNYLGIELNPEYIELANKRLQQMALFL